MSDPQRLLLGAFLMPGGDRVIPDSYLYAILFGSWLRPEELPRKVTFVTFSVTRPVWCFFAKPKTSVTFALSKAEYCLTLLSVVVRPVTPQGRDGDELEKP